MTDNPTMSRKTPRTRWGPMEKANGRRATYDVAFHPVGSTQYRYCATWAATEAEAVKYVLKMARNFKAEIEIDGVVQPANPGQRLVL